MTARVRAVAVCALAARPHDPAVEHPGHADVVDVGVRAGHFRRDVDRAAPRDPDQRVLADRLRRAPTPGVRASCPVYDDVEQLAADELAVGDRLAAAGDDALRPEARDRHAEIRRRQPEQRLLRLRPPLRTCGPPVEIDVLPPVCRCSATASAPPVSNANADLAEVHVRALRPRSAAGRSSTPGRARCARVEVTPCCPGGSRSTSRPSSGRPGRAGERVDQPPRPSRSRPRRRG